jgi:hypothetical protein
MLVLIKATVSDKRCEGRPLGNVVSGKAVEKTSAENVGAKEPPPGSEKGLRQGPLAALFNLPIQEVITEYGDLIQMTI